MLTDGLPAGRFLLLPVTDWYLYRVPSFKDKKTDAELLSDVSGVFNPGEMVALLGAERSDLDLPRSFAQPLSLMMCGLHGSGKTTSSGKLARLLADEDRKTLLVGADVYRPAAMDQSAVKDHD